jgi:2-polyprenyl-6-methoxyphenol hydroxylase-like FAD-dependent oxidoreductase
VVIVGAGIAGLASALALHRLGVKSLVLEEADSLRTGGTSLTLFKNGWRVLDVLGVAEDLRKDYTEILGLQIQTNDGAVLRSFSLLVEDKSQEVRGVERRALLESLARNMPEDTVWFGSHIITIERTKNSQIKLELDDGTQILTKILIGCDGVRSMVAKWMGFSEPRYVGHCAYRGLAVYANGQPYEQKVHYIYGKGIRAGYVPLSSTKVYWFICFNSHSPGPKITDAKFLKKEALQLVHNWPKELVETIQNTPDESFVRTPLVDRWLWPVVGPKSTLGGVALAGDAWHPMTPNLGQGACCALEDSIILARKLAKALDVGTQGETENVQRVRVPSDYFGGSKISIQIEEALQAYATERWPRIFPLTIRANLVGALLQWDNELICSLRDNIIIPKVVQLDPLLEHTKYDCGLLNSNS